MKHRKICWKFPRFYGKKKEKHWLKYFIVQIAVYSDSPLISIIAMPSESTSIISYQATSNWILNIKKSIEHLNKQVFLSENRQKIKTYLRDGSMCQKRNFLGKEWNIWKPLKSLWEVFTVSSLEKKFYCKKKKWKIFVFLE